MVAKQKIVVVGAGPVGSLAALYAAQRGHDVEIYELRPGKALTHCCTIPPSRHGVAHWQSDLRDPDTIPLNFTRSINLALSERGINAMRHAGQPALLRRVLAATVPMRGRM